MLSEYKPISRGDLPTAVLSREITFPRLPSASVTLAARFKSHEVEEVEDHPFLFIRYRRSSPNVALPTLASSGEAVETPSPCPHLFNRLSAGRHLPPLRQPSISVTEMAQIARVLTEGQACAFYKSG